MPSCSCRQRLSVLSPQYRWRRVGRLPLVFLFLITGLLACDQSHLLDDNLGPCTLVTQSQAERVLQDSPLMIYLGATTNENTYREHECNYVNEVTGNGTPHLVMRLLISQGISAAQTTFQSFIDQNNTEQGVHIIAGLGEQAFLSTSLAPVLYVLKDNGIVLVAVSNCCTSDSVRESQEQQLAQFAVQNM